MGERGLLYIYIYIYTYVWVVFRVYVAILASGEITENVCTDMKCFIFQGIRMYVLWVCDINFAGRLKTLKTSCFRCVDMHSRDVVELVSCTMLLKLG